LIEPIGEGGFGIVYLAERREPMVQRVAIKIIKPGMDTGAVVGRFEQERQALAVMDHPNVARVIDGGVTPSGRPYFVMEYVPGESITRYCDRHKLTIRQRLELFTSVCDAVQHAHHKGIIHRDLKPSNILVMQTDGRNVVKVIDFGIAKAINQTLTEYTAFTEHGQLIGTPEYMSPEQAEMGRLDIDTRTDVYSLGVVLYELIAGVLPFEPKMLRAAGFDEIRRIIREVDPQRPSTRLSTVDDESGAAISRQRQQQRAELTRELRRELDWIPLRALRKDRAERYASPADLARDIQNYLEGRALDAGPESSTYRVRKFVRRNRGPVAAIVAIALSLTAGFGTAVVQWQRAESKATAARLAEDRAHAQEKIAVESRDVSQATMRFIKRSFGEVRPELARGKEVTLREVIDRAAQSLTTEGSASHAVAAQVSAILGETYFAISDFDAARAQLVLAADAARKAWGASSEAAVLARASIAIVDFQSGTDRDAITVSAKELLGLEEQGTSSPSEVWATCTSLAALIGDPALSTPLLDLVDRLMSAAHEPDRSLDRALAHFVRATLLTDPAASLQAMRAATAMGEEIDPLHPSTLDMRGTLRLALQSRGQAEEAIAMSAETVDRIRKITTQPSRLLGDEIKEQGVIARALGKHDVAVERGREALAIYKSVGVTCDGASVLSAYDLVGQCLNTLARYTESVAIYDEAIESLSHCTLSMPTVAYYFRSNRAFAFSHLGEYDKAVKDLEQAAACVPSMDAAKRDSLLARITRGLERVRAGQPMQ
jgi:serine/threonine protein kinase